MRNGLNTKLTDPLEIALEQVRLNARTRGHSPDNTIRGYKTAVKQYIQFVNSELDLEEPIIFKDLIEEAREDVRYAQVRMRWFFYWLMGNNATEDERAEIEDYKPYGKSLKRTSASNRAFSNIRGLYTHNRIDFGKWSTPKTADMLKDTIENDRKHPIFIYDEETGVFSVNFEQLRTFANLLSSRDRTILLGLISTGQDIGDLLKLTLGWLREQTDTERLSWRGRRQKTKVPFWTFFSAEATRYMREYADIDRRDAPDTERIFYTRRVNDKPKPLTAIQYTERLGHAARKMGVYPEGSTQQPFRPKRMRHLFETACRRAGIPIDRSRTFMGHAGGVEMQYIERNLSEHKAFYAMVEPYLTIFGTGEVEALDDLKGKTEYQEQRIKELEIANMELKQNYDRLLDERIQDMEQFKQWQSEMEKRFKDLKESLSKNTVP
jgi:integrase